MYTFLASHSHPKRTQMPTNLRLPLSPIHTQNALLSIEIIYFGRFNYVFVFRFSFPCGFLLSLSLHFARSRFRFRSAKRLTDSLLITMISHNQWRGQLFNYFLFRLTKASLNFLCASGRYCDSGSATERQTCWKRDGRLSTDVEFNWSNK